MKALLLILALITLPVLAWDEYDSDPTQDYEQGAVETLSNANQGLDQYDPNAAFSSSYESEVPPPPEYDEYDQQYGDYGGDY